MINRLRISADSVSDYVLIEPTTGIPANDSYLLIDEAVEGQSIYRIVSNFDVKLDYNTGAGASVQNIPSDIEIRYDIVANPDFNTVIIPPPADRYRLPSQIVGVTKESYNSITYQLPEGVSDFYVSAKLFYVDGNEVFDSNGDPVDFIESLLGSYPIGSLTITKDPSSGTVAGDSVDYTVTPTGIGADLPDLRYSWSVSAASGGTSSTANRTTATPTITFDNDDTYTVTCTVSSVLTGESVVDTDEITVATAADDWDTYKIAETQQFTHDGTTFTPPAPYLTLTPSGTVFDPEQSRKSSFTWDVRTDSTSMETTVPWMAIWNVSTNVWTVHPWDSSGATSNSYKAYEHPTPASRQYEPQSASLPVTGNEIVLVGLSQYTPGDVTGWSNYS